MHVPAMDLTSLDAWSKEEILTRWKTILDTGTFIGGETVARFETEFAQACDVEHAIAVSSGTDALLLLLLALGVGPGDEVITPANTFIATAEAVSQTGATVVFADIDPLTYNIDPKAVVRAITPRTKGIIAVHLFGQPANMDALLRVAEDHGLWVAEDACQAHQAKYKTQTAGSIGVGAAFSFYPTKNLGACGEAGAVTTNRADLAETVRILRDHGQLHKNVHEYVGYNGRCDALQAAALSVKLRHLPLWNERRAENAARYTKYLTHADHVQLPHVSPQCVSSWHHYVVQVDRRDWVRDQLATRGIGTGIHYPMPLHLQPAYAHLGYHPGSLPVTEACAARILSLPMYPGLREDEIAYVCENLIDVTSPY